MDRIKLNIGGRIHITTLSTINKYPNTLLGKLTSKENSKIAKKDEDGSYFFDRNPDLFCYVLDFYRTGNIIYPTNVSKQDFLNELKFWGIDVKNEEFPTLEEIVNFNMLFVEMALWKGNSRMVTSLGFITESIDDAIKEKKRSILVPFCHNNVKELKFIFSFTKIEEILLPAKKNGKKWVSYDKNGHADISTTFEEEVIETDNKYTLQCLECRF